MLMAACVVLAGCATQNPEASQGDDSLAPIPSVAFTARDYAFDGPETIPAGYVNVSLANEGQELHHIQFLRAPPNMTANAAVAEASANEWPDWAVLFGGPNVAVPGGPPREATVRLVPGTYVLACYIPTADGTGHAALGMVKAVTVEQPASTTKQPAPADVEIVLDDFTITPATNLTTANRWAHVTNVGQEPHEATLFRLHGNASTEDLLAAFEPGGNGTMPGEAAGGTSFLSPGREVWVPLELEAGRYTFICFIHLEQGMWKEFEVA